MAKAEPVTKPAKHSHAIDDEWMVYSRSPANATEVEYRCTKCGELVVFGGQPGNP
jgi:hypothetical protein